MENTNRVGKIILAFSLPLAAIVIVTSCVGLLTPDFYFQETLNWQAQSLGQDLVDLFLLVPCLLITAICAYRKSEIAITLWGGVIFYFVYTFLIYCFDVHFNSMFLLYCFALGLSVFASLYFLHLQVKRQFGIHFEINKSVKVEVQSGMHFEINKSVKVIGIYFIIVAVAFYFLWLSEIIPAIIHHYTPKSLSEVGLPTNAVHVIDLSVFLPGLFIVGISMLRKNKSALFLAPVLLTFFVLMDITIGALIVVMKKMAMGNDLTIAWAMAVLALISLLFLIWFFKGSRKT